MFSDLVKRSRSARRFVESERITLEMLRGWVDLARLVPSAANLQPLKYLIIHEYEDCARFFPFTAWAGYLKDWAGPEYGQRPAAYILILHEKDKKEPAFDVGIAAQTIMLAATEAGYGGCMLGALKREEIHREFRLPENLAVSLALALGRPAEEIILEEAPAGCDAEGVKYWRDASGAHHVPKRPLTDILLS